MKTKISVADALRLNGCESGISRAVELSAQMGIPADSEVEFDALLEAANTSGSTALALFMMKNKADLLEYKDSSVQCYVLGGQKFESLEDARAARDAKRQERIEHHRSLTVCAFTESLGEDHSWVAIDIDAFVIPDGVSEYHFHVFNHSTGSYEEAATIEEAKAKRDANVASFMEPENELLKIYQRLVFAEDGVTTKDVPLE